MEKYGDLTLTEDWIESKSARIPIDSISYVRSIDLVPSTNAIFLIAAIVLGILAIAFFYVYEILIGFCLAIAAIIFYKLSNGKANTLMIASSSGFFIKEFSTKLNKSSNEQRHFINKIFEYRKNFIRNEKSIHDALTDVQKTVEVDSHLDQQKTTNDEPHTDVNTEKKGGLKISSNGDWECPICHTENSPPIGACKSCDNYIVAKR